jgi:hypothetical protein
LLFLSFFLKKLKVPIPFHFYAFFIIIGIIAFPSILFAVSQADVEKEYPSNRYIVGIGEVKASSNSMMDKRIADVRARIEIASQIRI